MTAPIPALRKLNKAMAKHGIRYCEACGNCYPLGIAHFYIHHGATYRYICIRCFLAQDAKRCRRMRNNADWVRRRRESQKKYYDAHYQRRTRRVGADTLTRKESAFNRILSGVHVVRQPQPEEQTS